MAGTVVLSTLNDSSGVLATQNGMTGIAKAWVQMYIAQGTGTVTLNGSFNISSVTRSSAGIFVANFTTAMPNANYSAVGTMAGDTSNSGSRFMGVFQSGVTTFTAPTTSSFNFVALQTNAVVNDPTYTCIAVFSS